MISTSTLKLKTVPLYEKPRNLERSIQVIAKSVRGTMNVLSAHDRMPAPAKYLAVIRDITTLKKLWKRHIEIERALSHRVSRYDLHSANSFSRIFKENEAIEKQLASLLRAPWPRSPQAGLLAMRVRAGEVLRRLLTQIELEGLQVP